MHYERHLILGRLINGLFSLKLLTPVPIFFTVSYETICAIIHVNYFLLADPGGRAI